MGTGGGAAGTAHNALWHGSRSVDAYERLDFIDEGSYGMVFRARDRQTRRIYAVKRIKMDGPGAAFGFPTTALREANALKALQHPHIVGLREMVVGKTMDMVFMVMEHCGRDLNAVLAAEDLRGFWQGEVKCLLRQLLLAVAHMHGLWYFHRDLKSSNLLYAEDGRLRVGDFGLARKFGDPRRAYTTPVVTLWYRAPELLLGASRYGPAVDMWSVGCLFAEFLLRRPLFAGPREGDSEEDHMRRVFSCVGRPTKKRWPDFASLPRTPSIEGLGWWDAGDLPARSEVGKILPRQDFRGGGPYLGDSGVDLLSRMLEMNPRRRISAEDALSHPYFGAFPKPVEALPPLAALAEP